MNIEERRRKNIEDNKRILKEIGLLNPVNFLPKVTLKKTGIKRKAETEIPRRAKRPVLEEIGDNQRRGSIAGIRRRSARLLGGNVSEEDLQRQINLDLEEEEDKDQTPKKSYVYRPMTYGAIEGVEVGASWETRMECSKDGVHRMTVAGIHGGPEGAYSIALSGGYDDNIDMGYYFTYTGEGGRDLKGTKSNPKNLRTAPQSKDQYLSKGNLALSKSVETGNPVRVIRGYKLTSPFAPEEGYRYDGLYTVQKAWYTTGLSSFQVWKFALKRMEDQAAPPWTIAEEFGVNRTSMSDSSDTTDQGGKAKDSGDDKYEPREDKMEMDKALDDRADVGEPAAKEQAQVKTEESNGKDSGDDKYERREDKMEMDKAPDDRADVSEPTGNEQLQVETEEDNAKVADVNRENSNEDKSLTPDVSKEEVQDEDHLKDETLEKEDEEDTHVPEQQKGEQVFEKGAYDEGSEQEVKGEESKDRLLAVSVENNNDSSVLSQN